MLSDPIIRKSFSRFDQKRIGRFAIFGCAIIALSICTVFKPQFHVHGISSISLQLPRSGAIKDPIVTKNIIRPEPLQSSEPLQLSTSDGANDREAATNITISKPLQSSSDDGVTGRVVSPDRTLFSATGADVNDTYIAKDTTETKPMQLETDEFMKGIVVANDTLVPEPIEVEVKLTKLVCSLSEPISDYCEIEGDIRIHPNSSTIYIASHQTNSSFEYGTSWVIKPYARKGNEQAMATVKSWTIKVIPSHQSSPICTTNQNIPAILFSVAGYSGNHFHDFTDTIIPLFSTSRKFDGEVHFLATNYQWWWISKFQGILDKLSRHRIIDIDREEGTLCYKSMIIGLKTRKELSIDAHSNIYEGFSMKDFREFLRSAYSLQRKTVVKIREGMTEKPRMMIISRKRTRTIMNERRVTKLGESMGYEVIVADATISTNLSKFAELVNSCDVMMGVHGAGLTNMLFLPDNAVVIQIVLLGIEWYARHDFEEPAGDMNVRYMGYKIKVKESSLIQQYSVDSAIIKDPLSVYKHDWDVIRTIYLDKQNVILDVRRFRSTLLKALKFLHQ